LALIDEAGRRVRELACTKVGRAKHTVASRLPPYRRDVLGGVPIVDGSQTLRVVVYGSGPTMLLERDMQRVARCSGSRAEVVDEAGARRRVGSETYSGTGMVEELCSLARNGRQEIAKGEAISRPRRSADYERAKHAIQEYLRDGEWHGSKELHEDLADEVPRDWLFGAVKREFGIEIRRMHGRFYWRLPPLRLEDLLT
jgi:hypothetical protein